jgi:hypothetical protein
MVRGKGRGYVQPQYIMRYIGGMPQSTNEDTTMNTQISPLTILSIGRARTIVKLLKRKSSSSSKGKLRPIIAHL